MSKATPNDVMALGFTDEMFKPTVGTSAEFGAYIQVVLDIAADEVKRSVGSANYEDVQYLVRIKQAEVYFVAAELWDRRGNIVLRNRAMGGGAGTLLNMTESVKAEEYRNKAVAAIESIKLNSGNIGFASSCETSSHFPQDEQT